MLKNYLSYFLKKYLINNSLYTFSKENIFTKNSLSKNIVKYKLNNICKIAYKAPFGPKFCF